MGKKLNTNQKAILSLITDIANVLEEQERADGCAGCVHDHKEFWEMPCAKCVRNSTDYYKRKEENE